MLNSDQQKAKIKAKSWWYSDHQAFTIGGRAGTGKAQPLDEPVLTPEGFKPMGEIAIGDTVYSEKGKPIKVIATYNHENIQMYEITFIDGSSTRCCEDHLWQVQTKKDRILNRVRILKTLELIYCKTTRLSRSGEKTEYHFSIPLVKPIEFSSVIPRISPYILGYALGNGSSIKTSLVLSCHSQDWLEIQSNIGEDNIMSTSLATKNCRIIALTPEVRLAYDSYNLTGVRSLDKKIPKESFLWSIKDRVELLAGLMDSDGCSNNNKIRFNTSSRQLACGVQQLVFSLGGICSLKVHDRENGKSLEYYLTIRLPFNPFKLKRKASDYIISKRYPTDRRTIYSVEKIGVMDGKCITVDNPTSLYITKDYTVTHNSYLCDEILQSLPGVKPLVISPTHEALKQIKDKISFPDAVFKTAHSSLGLMPIDSEKEIKFEETKLPAIWEEVNLCIADEVSMNNKTICNLLLSTGTKIIGVGHKSQLPPIDIRRNTFDKCVSPWFDYGFPEIELTIPQRNTGELWDFCNELESHIYEDRNVAIPFTFDVTKKNLDQMIKGEKSIKIFNGEVKFVLWSNDAVNRYNDRFRLSYFGEKAKFDKYLPGDKIILTAPYTNIEMLEKHSERSLLSLLPNKEALHYLYSNTKATVKHCSAVSVKLASQLTIQCYKIFVAAEGEEFYIYEPVYPADHNKIATYYEHRAWGFKDINRRKKAYRERHFIRSMFAQIKHFYAATAHRLQGSTIPEIILINSDIDRNPCRVERLKCRYVAASRAKDNLYFYRGL